MIDWFKKRFWFWFRGHRVDIVEYDPKALIERVKAEGCYKCGSRGYDRAQLGYKEGEAFGNPMIVVYCSDCNPWQLPPVKTP